MTSGSPCFDSWLTLMLHRIVSCGCLTSHLNIYRMQLMAIDRHNGVRLSGISVGMLNGSKNS